MTKTIQRSIRLFILLLLLYNVYLETGIWTVAAFVWVFAWQEITGYIMARWTAINAMLLSAYEKPKGKDNG